VLTAAMGGIATPVQRRALADREVARYLGSPWQEWPSWSWVVAEAATALGRRDLSGQLAASVLRRVYPENDRRLLAPDGGPLPGVAREWWPLDLESWTAGEAYGWGGTTALLLLRHVLGILEPPRPQGGPALRLAPAFPDDLLEDGRCYGIANVPWQGHRLDVEYRVRGGELDTRVTWRDTGQARRLRLRNGASRVLAP
jgi:hypothetical protein